MPSRQERRKAERDAAKRAPAKAGAVDAGGAAAARANVQVTPLGDWSTQTEDSAQLGAKILEQKADEGDAEAQFSMGGWLLSKADAGAGSRGAAATSPTADELVGLELCTNKFPAAQDRGALMWSRRIRVGTTHQAPHSFRSLSANRDALIRSPDDQMLCLRVPTLGGGGRCASGEGGGARARVRYACVGGVSPQEDGARTIPGVGHEVRRGRVAGSDVPPRPLSGHRAGRRGAGLPGKAVQVDPIKPTLKAPGP